MGVMTVSEAGLKHLQQAEGSRLKAYKDTGGIWTIGFGHTGTVDGIPIHEGMTITKAQEWELLKQDKEKFERAVNSVIKVPLTQNQFDALFSFAYNLGETGLRKSSVAKLINAGNYAAAADKMLEFNKVKKNGEYQFEQGVFNRRKREREMFLGVGQGEAPNIPIPNSLDEEIDAPINPLQNFAQATPLDQIMQSHDEPMNNHQNQQQALAQSFYQLNDTFSTPEQAPTLTAFEPQEQPDYSEKLASAFGITPSTQGKIPDYIGDMIKSIYDQTA